MSVLSTRPAGQVDLGSGPWLTASERAARGKAARAEVPRSAHAEFTAPPARPDPLDLLETQSANRVPELMPIRYGRMAVSPFSFFRGAALVMAHDLAGTPRSGFRTQLCGDAHLLNFGVFGTPERQLVFDINDFDETLPGPWEWDVKRLAASVEIAARDSGFSPRDRRNITTALARQYRTAMREFAEMPSLAVWYAQADTSVVQERLSEQLSAKWQRQVSRGLAKARTRDSMQALAKLTTVVDGELRIVASPPLIEPVADVFPEMSQRKAFEDEIGRLLRGYRESLPPERRVLLDEYRSVDMARKVVGVGSVGTRCWILLLFGRDERDPLFLQAKEAGPSVLESFAGVSEYANCGQRVVVGQRIMQATSDIFLGWREVVGWDDGRRRDFYIRQLRDWKGSADVASMTPRTMTSYGELCGWTLARAHARCGDRIAIASYLGSGTSFDTAIATFADAYADQNEQDYRALVSAIGSGRIIARSGL